MKTHHSLSSSRFLQTYSEQIAKTGEKKYTGSNLLINADTLLSVKFPEIFYQGETHADVDFSLLNIPKLQADIIDEYFGDGIPFIVSEEDLVKHFNDCYDLFHDWFDENHL